MVEILKILSFEKMVLIFDECVGCFLVVLIIGEDVC